MIVGWKKIFRYFFMYLIMRKAKKKREKNKRDSWIKKRRGRKIMNQKKAAKLESGEDIIAD